MNYQMAWVVATWGGIGRIPAAPGTWGSVAAVAIGYVVVRWTGIDSAWLGLAGAALIPLGAWAARVLEDHTGREDPQEVVVDEVSGQWIALVFARPDHPLDWWIGLALFRLFDVWKPGPIRSLEAKPNGYGVMLDDVAAGLCAMMILGLVSRIF